MLNNHVFSAFDGPFRCAYGYRAADNTDATRLRPPATWKTRVYRAVIDCAAVAGPDHGRAVTPADAAVVVDILNRGHADEEMYVPYTPTSLAARLERAPELYSWRNERIGDRAVLGVWPAHLVVTLDDGVPVPAVRAVALDHGFVDGAEIEFERLLRAYCRQLREHDHDELTVMTSENSPNYELLCKLAHRMDPFEFNMELPEPAGTIEHGVYVDASTSSWNLQPRVARRSPELARRPVGCESGVADRITSDSRLLGNRPAPIASYLKRVEVLRLASAPIDLLWQ